MTRDEDDDPRDLPVPASGTPISDDGYKIYGEEIEEDVLCCGLTGTIITYPVTADPAQMPKVLEAPRTPAVGASQIFLHNGAFFQNDVDMTVDVFALPLSLSRHWRGDVKHEMGGVLGNGWDFSLNKRIVASGVSMLGTGLWSEPANSRASKLMYFNGHGRGELYLEKNSERRDVRNFDRAFLAYVTTYASPPGQFHEFQRYIVDEPADHPFFGHPDIEANERIFFVLREKNGTRYIFNCRGQLIYVLSRHDRNTPQRSEGWVRTELRYAGAFNPLTRNDMLSQVFDTTGRQYKITTSDTGLTAAYVTNRACKLDRGVLPVHRFEAIEGAGHRITYSYGGASKTLLQDVSVQTGSVDRKWNYRYDVDRLSEVRDPNGCVKDEPYVQNFYDGAGRVTSQSLGNIHLRIRYDGTSVTVQDSEQTRKTYQLDTISDFPVITSVSVTGRTGAASRTSREYNASTQVTRFTHPSGYSESFTYDSGNESVVLGPIRDKPGITYENNLTLGNLLTATRTGGGKSYSSSHEYDPLYNQLSRSIDAEGAETRIIVGYQAHGTRGNPISVVQPELTSSDGQKTPRTPEVYSYNERGQRIASKVGDRETLFRYNVLGQLIRIDYPAGTYISFNRNARNVITRQETPQGFEDFTLDGADRPARVSIAAGGRHTVTVRTFDANGNVVEMREDIGTSVSPADAAAWGLTSRPLQRISRWKYDALSRVTEESVSAGEQRVSSEYVYGPAGALTKLVTSAPAGPGVTESTFSYDALGSLIAVDERSGGLSRRKRYQHDADGNPITEISGYSGAESTIRTRYDGLGRPDQVTGPNGSVQTLTYDGLDRPIGVKLEGDRGTTGRGILYAAEYSYDPYDNIVYERTEGFESAPLEIRRQYDRNGLLSSVTGANGGRFTFEYDSENRLTKISQPDGGSTTNFYNRLGQLERSEQLVYEPTIRSGVRPRLTPITHTKRYRYGVAGRVVAETTDAGTTELVHDRLGQVLATRQTGDPVSRFEYDGFGRMTASESNGVRQTTSYWPSGLVRTKSGPNSQLEFRYDGFGREIERIERIGARRTAHKYDARGLPIETTDPSGTRLMRTFDQAGRMTKLRVVYGGDVITLPDRSKMPLMGGTREEAFVYDGLDRVVRAQTDQGSDVRLSYDGHGRVVREAQLFGGRSDQVSHRYGSDFGWSETTYPDGTRVRYDLDRLGRVEAIRQNDRTIAEYLYGAAGEKVAWRKAGNGVESYFSYDPKTLMLRNAWVTKPGAGLAGEPLWDGVVDFQGFRPTKYTERLQPRFPDAPPATETTVTWTPGGQIASQLTQSFGTGQSVPLSRSGSFSNWKNGQLESSAEYSLVHGAEPKLRFARVDAFTRDSASRVVSTTTSGFAGSELPEAAPGDLTAVRLMIDDQDDPITRTQEFKYDTLGRVVWDGRFAYAYDHRGKVTRVQDTWSPYRYSETLSLRYDGFGRRITATQTRDRAPSGLLSFGPVWPKPETWFVHSGDTLIAEYATLPGPGSATKSLLARYVYGAGNGEILRMDRRPEDSSSGTMPSYYFHNDLRGTYRFLTNDLGQLRMFHNLDPGPGDGAGASQRAPGDEIFVDGTKIRVPYLAPFTRVDGFAGSAFGFGDSLLADHRSAYAFGRDLDQISFRSTMNAFQAKMTLLTAGIAAAPFVAVAASAYVPAGIASGAINGAWQGAALNVGLNVIAAGVTQSPYTAENFVEDGLRGAMYGGVGGAVSGAVGVTFGRAANLKEQIIIGAAEVSADFTSSLLLDASIGWLGGMEFLDAAEASWKNSAWGAGLGFGLGRLNAGIRRLSMLSIDPTVPRDAPSPFADSIAVTYKGGYRARADDLQGAVIHTKSPELIVLENQINANLLNSGGLTREIAARLQSGTLKLRFEAMGNSGEFAWMMPNRARNVLHINTDMIPRHPITGRLLARDVTSTVIHEAIHALGGGEVSAHAGQSRFIHVSALKAGRRMKGVEWSKDDMPDVDRITLATTNSFLKHSFVELHRFVRDGAGYAAADIVMPRAYRWDPWVTSVSDFRRLIGLRDPMYDLAIARDRRNY